MKLSRETASVSSLGMMRAAVEPSARVIGNAPKKATTAASGVGAGAPNTPAAACCAA